MLVRNGKKLPKMPKRMAKNAVRPVSRRPKKKKGKR